MFGERLKRLRTGSRMTQAEVAQRLGISTSAVGMYEQNRREPSYDLLNKISELFGVSIDFLLSREDEPNDDLDAILSAFQQHLQTQQGLMFHGQLLSAADVEKIVRAMRLGAELTLRETHGDKLP